LSHLIYFTNCWVGESNGCIDEVNVVVQEAPGKVALGALDGVMTAEDLYFR